MIHSKKTNKCGMITFRKSLEMWICRSSPIQNTHFLWHAGKVLCGWLVVRQPKTAGPSLETTTWTIRVTLDQLGCWSSIYGTFNSQRTWTWVRNHEKVNNMYFHVFYRLVSFATWLEDWMVSNSKTWPPEKTSETKNIFHKMHLDDVGARKEGENREEEGERKRGRADRERGRWMKQAAENPVMTAATRDNMPNPGSHFLLRRRLLWNSSSVANVTTRRERWRDRLLTPPSSFPSLSLPSSSPSWPSTLSCLWWG